MFKPKRGKKINLPQVPEGFTLTKESKQEGCKYIFAVNAEGKYIVWVTPGKNREGIFVEGFWQKTEALQGATPEQVSRFRAWLKE